MKTHDKVLISELFELIILNELLKKDLLVTISKYIKHFGTSFDFSRPIAYVDFYGFLREKELDSLKLTQFLFNLEVFIVKLYKIGEVDKPTIKGTKLKSLRQSFAHRKSSDILASQERLVMFTGLTYDFGTFLLII